MPCLVIHTNVAKPASTDAFFEEATKTVASLTGKPAAYIQVRLQTDQQMSFGGSTEPTAEVTLGNVGNIKTSTEKCSSAICELLKKQLGIPSNRVYVFFTVFQGSNVGYDGRTF
ncbi:macrophage migration inhibitory factor [Lingula anatina]|uniref:L-dopachrome isomerase n=1 Tax=Lingula anatina TaxID=7574 RepID=A0A1S3H1Q2_LINAN|nr:macrophage migration inhibitory factor [Lingula anatina]|eukprot:XP_013379411.1 macrophage migration inhibitory factor [Lingula anatina]